MSFDSTASLNVTDPQARYVSISCLDLLLIELVPMAERIAQELELGISVKSSSPPSSSSPSSSPDTDDSNNKDKEKEREKEKSSTELDEEDLREATYFRLEALGYRVGVGLAERYVLVNLSLLNSLRHFLNGWIRCDEWGVYIGMDRL